MFPGNDVRRKAYLSGGFVIGLLALWITAALAQPPSPTPPVRPNGGWGAVWSPEGKQLAFLSSQDGLPPEAWVSDREGKSYRRLTHGGADDLSWSADGRTLRFATHRRGPEERWQVSLDTGQEQPEAAITGIPADTFPVLSPDGKVVAYTAAGEPPVRDLYLRTGTGTAERVTEGFVVGQVVWSPKGDRIAFDGLNPLSKGLPQVWLYDLRSKRLAHIGSTGSSDPVWSAKGDYLAYTVLYGSKGNRIAIAKPEAMAEKRAPGKHTPKRVDAPGAPPLDARAGDIVETLFYRGEGMAWSPKADTLAVVARTEKDQQVVMLKANGRMAATLTKQGMQFRFPTWSPDGKRLAFEAVRTGVSAFSEVWVTDARGKMWTDLAPSRPSYWALYPAAGDRLYCLGNTSGTIQVWSAQGAARTALPHTEGATAVAVSTRGDRVLVLKPKEATLLSAEGMELSTLPLNGGVDAQWSPHDDRVAVGVQRAGSDAAITLLSVSAEGKLAEMTSVPGADAAWSPDGASLVCVRGKALWRAEADGEHPTNLVTLPVADGEDALLLHPAWDAQGTRLAFGVIRTTPTAWQQELWVLPTDETASPRKIHSDAVTTEYATSPAHWSAFPAWSGDHILFDADLGGSPQVWSIRPDGTELQALTPPEAIWPALGPEGVYFFRPEADAPLWKVAVDGSNLASLPWGG